MGSGVDSYLHKKFKKQLSIAPIFQNHARESKESDRVVDASQEKGTDTVVNSPSHSQLKTDNNESVPNQSTNQNSSYFTVNSSSNSKSSISVEKCVAAANLQSNSSISSVVSRNSEEEQPTAINFDTSFNTPEPSTVSTSSNLADSVYSKQTFYVSSTSAGDGYQSREDPGDMKEEVQPPPDRNSNGKYVCTYCNLACSKPSVLQKHIRAHTNERPFPCHSCGFSFKTRSNLYKHCRSRTHANRVLGNNRAQELNNEVETQGSPGSSKNLQNEERTDDSKSKPYKPRFHSGKAFFLAKENIEDEPQEPMYSSNDFISHHINEIINKNSSIVNINDPNMLKKRANDKRANDATMDTVNNNDYIPRYRVDSPYSSDQKSIDEPLNLTNKNRKRSMSEVAEPVAQKSLIKELLLKNLYFSNDLMCKYCKMLFQTVTELELHEFRNCKGKPSGAKYTRSSSVNVASILTQNKNAFDNIPHLQNTTFPLNSPGPFLGKTRLVESDKSKSFSFDDGLKANLTFPTMQFEKIGPVKLFGGEVKIAHTSGESKSYKIDNDDVEKYDSARNFVEYGQKLSENRVIKSSLQSGGTVLTNKANFNKQDPRVPQDVIRLYENTSVSPSIDLSNLNKSKVNFVRQETVPDRTNQNEILRPIVENRTESPSSSSQQPQFPKHSMFNTNIMDFSQKAAQLLTPNLKQLNVPAVSVPNKFVFNVPADIKTENEKHFLSNSSNIQSFENRKQMPQIPKKLMSEIPSPVNNICNPMNLLVDGRVVRYVPGMPGPVVAENPPEMLYQDTQHLAAVSRIAIPLRKSPIPSSSVPNSPSPASTADIEMKEMSPSKSFNNKLLQRLSDVPAKPVNNFLNNLEVQTDVAPKVSEKKSPNGRNAEFKSPVKSVDIKSPLTITISETKKFVRPNSLALKPTSASLKQHHGLTPTMFNQILISPDTPRVAKKYEQHFLHGNYFSYLGLKSSTKPVYCTLNKTQPYYVPHVKKLSMYSEWRQQDTKQDKLYVSAYDSRQKQQKYTMAGKTQASFIMHSSYKFVVSELPISKIEKDEQKNNQIFGGYECNEDYTYIRGRGRGRYVCEQCGIRCKKPSMLKKHIRTHSNDRPFTCSHCNFSFKTKGNLTKHMKSKVHTKNFAANGSSSSSTQQSGTQSSESDTEDSGMDSSDESTRQQEHEAAYGLLSLSQKSTQNIAIPQSDVMVNSSPLSNGNASPMSSTSMSDVLMSSEEIAHVTKKNYAKNKIMDERSSLSFSAPKNISEMSVEEPNKEMQTMMQFLGKTTINRPLTYPYTTVFVPDDGKKVDTPEKSPRLSNVDAEGKNEPKCIKQFHVIQKYASHLAQPPSPKKVVEAKDSIQARSMDLPQSFQEKVNISNAKKNHVDGRTFNQTESVSSVNYVKPPVLLYVNDVLVSNDNNEMRKRKFTVIENNYKNKIPKNDEVMDLSIPSDKPNEVPPRYNGNSNLRLSPDPKAQNPESPTSIPEENRHTVKSNGSKVMMISEEERLSYFRRPSSDDSQPYNYDNSAMETLADIATKQVKLEKNTLAKSVASEFLKLAKNEANQDGGCDSNNFGSMNKDVNDIIVKSEGQKSCAICQKSFNKPSQLKLHMNIHYLERPFRCESCSVSFRTKGHLQKHERSASHHNKLSSSPALSSSEPRPFKCCDCNVAFRIHGHLAKHLRSKMHIMKLECLAKIPFGLYAELERSNSLLTEINTCDGDQCLESLKTLAKRVFINDPSKLNQLETTENVDADP